MQILNGRIYFLDAMRGILMMLGVILHSAQVFNPNKDWSIYSNNSTIIATYLVDAIHVFRMPAFFIVSGYFCLLTIKRYGPKKFYNIRIKRILIPLLFTALTLNTVQIIVLTKTGWNNLEIVDYLVTGGWVSHLWFLINLVVYFTIAFISALLFSNIINKLNLQINKVTRNLPFPIILLILPISLLAIKIFGKFGLPIYEEIFGFINIYDLLYFSPYFLFGLWLRANLTELERFSSINILISISIFILSLYIYIEFKNSTSATNLVIYEYFHSLAVWYLTAICFYLFKNYANTHSKLFMFLSDASYTVYLFHHILVIGIGLLLINLGFGGISGLLTLIISVFAITFSIHAYVISKVPVLQYLYNGK